MRHALHAIATGGAKRDPVMADCCLFERAAVLPRKTTDLEDVCRVRGQLQPYLDDLVVGRVVGNGQPLQQRAAEDTLALDPE